jgi:hypothetical protein
MPLDFDINLDSNIYPETWFGDAPGKRVCLRLCSPDQVEEFRKECFKQKKQAVLNPVTRHMELADDSDFDSDKFVELLVSHNFVDWDLVDAKGEAIAFTPENRKTLMKMPRFQKFIEECLQELNKQAGITQDKESKNSESSQER